MFPPGYHRNLLPFIRQAIPRPARAHSRATSSLRGRRITQNRISSQSPVSASTSRCHATTNSTGSRPGMGGRNPEETLAGATAVSTASWNHDEVGVVGGSTTVPRSFPERHQRPGADPRSSSRSPGAPNPSARRHRSSSAAEDRRRHGWWLRPPAQRRRLKRRQLLVTVGPNRSPNRVIRRTTSQVSAAARPLRRVLAVRPTRAACRRQSGAKRFSLPP